MPAFLENLAKEYDLFKRLGFDDRIFSRDVKDRNGKTYEVIYQNFSPNCNPAKDEPKSVTEDTEVSVQTNAFRTNYNINARLNDEVAMQLHYIIINFLRERYLSAKAA